MSETLGSALSRAIRARLSEVHTAIPAEVREFDADERRVRIRPLIRRRRGAEFVAMPDVWEVPVQMPGGASGGLAFPVNRGDTGLAIFAEREIEGWADRGGMRSPKSGRRFDLSDAIFVPGVWPFPDARGVDPDRAELYHRDGADVAVGAKVRVRNDAESMADLMADTMDEISSISVDPETGTMLPTHVAALGAIAARWAALLED